MYALQQVKMRLVVASLAVLLGAGGQTAATAHDFEVWLVDQSNSTELMYGGTIYIYDGADLQGKHLSDAAPTATIDLAGAPPRSVGQKPAPTRCVRICSCSIWPIVMHSWPLSRVDTWSFLTPPRAHPWPASE